MEEARCRGARLCFHPLELRTEGSRGWARGTERGPRSFKARAGSELMDPRVIGNWVPPWACKIKAENYLGG